MANVTVGEIMTTKLRTLGTDDTVTIAEWEMNLDEIRHILIVNRERKLVGIISDRDVLRARHAANRVPVGMIMSSPPISVTPSTSAATALERLLDARISALPVVDDTGCPVGIVTTTDFLEVARWALYGADGRAPHARGQRPAP